MTIHSHPIVSGAQIRAARALLGWRREDLADEAGIHCNSVSYWEAKDEIPASEPHACRQMREAMEKAGVEAFLDPMPGVRYVRPKRTARCGTKAREDAFVPVAA